MTKEKENRSMKNEQHTIERYGVIYHHRDNTTTKKLFTMKYNIAIVAIYADMYDPDVKSPITGASVYEIDSAGNPVSLKHTATRHWWM